MQRPHSITRALTVAAAAVGLLAACTAPAATASPTTPPAAAAAIVPSTIQYITKSFANTGTVFGTVGCPAGTFVVNISASGGYSPTGDPAAGRIRGMAPLRSLNAPPRAANFTAAGVIGEAAPGRPLFVKVGCLPAAQLANAITVSKSFGTGPTDRFVDRQVDCPADKPVAFGGGGYYLRIDNRYSAAGEMHSNTVTANGRSWIYRSLSHVSTDKLVVSTQCASLPGSHVATSRGSVRFGTHGLGGAECDPGQASLSGGMENIASVYSSQQFSTSMEVVADDVGEPFPLIVHLQCIPASSF
jgi:hypothetical protein